MVSSMASPTPPTTNKRALRIVGSPFLFMTSAPAITGEKWHYGASCGPRPMRNGAAARLRVQTIKEGGEPLHCKFRRLGVVNDLAFHGIHDLDAFGNPGGEIKRDVRDPVLIAMQQITGLYRKASNPHRRSNFHDVYVGVVNCDVGGEELETEGLNFVEVAHRSVSDGAHTPHGL